jgi:hypothetical protein
MEEANSRDAAMREAQRIIDDEIAAGRIIDLGNGKCRDATPEEIRRHQSRTALNFLGADDYCLMRITGPNKLPKDFVMVVAGVDAESVVRLPLMECVLVVEETDDQVAKVKEVLEKTGTYDGMHAIEATMEELERPDFGLTVPKVELTDSEVNEYEARAEAIAATEPIEVLFAIAAKLGMVDGLGGGQYRSWAIDRNDE